MPLTYQDILKNGIFDEIVNRFSDLEFASILLDRIGFPEGLRPLRPVTLRHSGVP